MGRYEKPKTLVEVHQHRLQNNIDTTYECIGQPNDETLYHKKSHAESKNVEKFDAPPLPPPLPQWNHSHTAHRMQRNYRNSDDSLDDLTSSDQVNGKGYF